MTDAPHDTQTILFSDHWSREMVFSAKALAKVQPFTALQFPILSAENYADYPDLLSSADYILSTWGMPRLTADFLRLMPKLKAVFYAAGSVKEFVTEESWEREIVVCSAADANAVPVAEYALSTILLSLKRFWHHAALAKAKRWERDALIPGGYESTVGLVSMGVIARKVVASLKNFDVEILAYDPFISPEEARQMGVRLVSLETIFQESDVVSLHSPWIPETVGMIHRALLEIMKPGATLINTARGAIINEPDLCEVMQQRPDLTALLDVTWPEPPAENSPLYTLDNVVLTPHIAGSLGPECGRMVAYMADEFRRYTAGDALRHRVTRDMLARMA